MATETDELTPEMVEQGALVLLQATPLERKGAEHYAAQVWRAMAAAKPSLDPLPANLERVVLRLEEAAQTFKLWCAGRGGPVQRQAWWPDVIHNTFEAHNAEAPRGPGRVTLYAADIDRMWEAMHWLDWIQAKRKRRIVWLRAQQVTWRSLEERDGWSHVTLRKMHREALMLIAARLAVSPAPQPANIVEPRRRGLQSL